MLYVIFPDVLCTHQSSQFRPTIWTHPSSDLPQAKNRWGGTESLRRFGMVETVYFLDSVEQIIWNKSLGID